MSENPNIKTARLPAEAYAKNFADIAPPLTTKQSLTESERCYYCYDAPCMEACPTGIDIPGFIRKIASDNPAGAARTILSANIMGGTCARVCPVDTLCEGACVREHAEGKPVKIGLLQRYATDHFFASEQAYPFTRAADTDFHIAIIGAGPAGLACAHLLARHGHQITIFEADTKAGGLNIDGLAAYKITNEFVAEEINFILQIGGIHIEYNKMLGRDFSLTELRQKFAAVFIATGLQNVNALNIEGENLKGVMNAVDYIASLRTTQNLATLPVGKQVVVIGGGNTAVDIASQIKRLGATSVTMLYRRGLGQLKATLHEQTVVQNDGVTIRCNAMPIQLLGQAGHVVAVECEETVEKVGKLIGNGERFTLAADMVFKAIGQQFDVDPIDAASKQLLKFSNDRLWVNEQRATSIAGVFAGGDCVMGGNDLTVTAVEDGKLAAAGIHHYLTGSSV